MGTITISVEDETEKLFRKLASAKYGKRKGALGEAVTEAMQIWLKTQRISGLYRLILIFPEEENFRAKECMPPPIGLLAIPL